MESKNEENGNFTRNVGYSYNGVGCLENLFSKENVDSMSKEITSRLKGIDCNGRDIVVPNNTIYSVLTNIQENYRSNTGDVFTRYNLNRIPPIDDYAYMRSQTIEVIVDTVIDTLKIEENNRKLTVWTSILGEHNNHRLRSHDILKIRKRRPAPMQFNMNY